MVDEFNTSNPIYLQLAERINKQILRYELKSGEKLPSVREMAINAGVNPNTVQRTYSELERMSIVETRRGQGTFVTEDQNILSELRRQMMKEYIDRFVQNMADMGFSHQEMLTGLEKHLENR